jgi:hypothetical protein
MTFRNPLTESPFVSSGLGKRETGAGGAYALVFANRTVAVYAAALPHDLRFARFVALYQVPIFFTALVLRRFPGRSRGLTPAGTKPKTR